MSESALDAEQEQDKMFPKCMRKALMRVVAYSLSYTLPICMLACVSKGKPLKNFLQVKSAFKINFQMGQGMKVQHCTIDKSLDKSNQFLMLFW